MFVVVVVADVKADVEPVAVVGAADVDVVVAAVAVDAVDAVDAAATVPVVPWRNKAKALEEYKALSVG